MTTTVTVLTTRWAELPLHHAIRVVGKHRGYRVTDQTAWSTTMIVEGDQAYGGGV